MAKVFLDKLREHAETMLRIRERLFKELKRERSFSDGLTETLGEQAKSAVMPLAFGAEAITIPIGVFSSTAAEISRTGYLAINAGIKNDKELRRFSVDNLRGTEESKTFELLFSVAFSRLRETLSSPDPKALAPYAAWDDLDLQTWRLAALVDLDDLFFVTNPLSDAFRAEQAELHGQFLGTLSSALSEISGITQLPNFPDRLNFRGWYVSPSVMTALDDLVGKKVSERSALKKTLPYLPGAGDKGKWQDEFRRLLNHHAVVESTLVSTRAVTAVTAVAQAVYADWTPPKGDVDPEVLQALKDTKTYFDTLEKEVLRSDEFGKFVLGEFERLTEKKGLDEALYDTFIHLLGILAFALPRGYFSADAPDGDPKKIDRESFRPNLQTKRYKCRADVIRRIMEILKLPGFRAELTSDEGFLGDSTYFVATARWDKLFDAQGNEVSLRSPEEKGALVKDKETGEEHAFEYVLALPLVVKALAHLSFEERLRQMAIPTERWNDIVWPGWLEDVETVAEGLCSAMVDLEKGQLRQGDGGVHGVWKGKPDLSVTAGVVDALSLWCANLLCRAALRDEFKADETPATLPSPSSMDDEDSQVVLRFFKLLERHTQRLSDGANGASNRPQEPVLPPEWAWFSLLFEALQDCFPPLRDGFDWSERSLKQTDYPVPELRDILMLIGLIRHLQRSAPSGQAQQAAVATKVLTEMKAQLINNKKSTFWNIFVLVALSFLQKGRSGSAPAGPPA